MFLSHLVPWPPVDIHEKLRSLSQGNPSVRGLKHERVAKYIDFGPTEGYILKRCKRGDNLVLIINRKSYMSFRMVPKAVTLILE